MPYNAQPPISEFSILSSYLLNPSPLPQIVSFNDFVKTCVPSQHRHHPHVKRLYRDLQFQRSIDVDAVRENIERECARAGALKGRLAANLAIESGDAPSLQTKKRKRNARVSSDLSTLHVPDQGQMDDGKPSDDDEFGKAPEVEAASTLYDYSLHPAAATKVVSASASRDDKTTSAHEAGSGAYHTTVTLLTALDRSLESLESEKNALEDQCTALMRDLQETVSQLSDLRYGKLNPPPPSGLDESFETAEEGMVDTLTQLEAMVKKASSRAQGISSHG